MGIIFSVKPRFKKVNNCEISMTSQLTPTDSLFTKASLPFQSSLVSFLTPRIFDLFPSGGRGGTLCSTSICECRSALYVHVRQRLELAPIEHCKGLTEAVRSKPKASHWLTALWLRLWGEQLPTSENVCDLLWIFFASSHFFVSEDFCLSTGKLSLCVIFVVCEVKFTFFKVR